MEIFKINQLQSFLILVNGFLVKTNGFFIDKINRYVGKRHGNVDANTAH